MSHNDVIASSTYNGAPPPLLRDYEQHKGLMHSRWFFDWYLSNPVRSKLHLITAIKLQKNVNDLEWLSDIDEETGTFVGLLATISTIHIPHNAKYEAALRDVLLAFSQAASQIATAVTVVPVSDGPEKEKQRFTAALERQLTLSPVWSVNLDFYRGAQISAPVNCRNNRRYFVDGLAVLLEKATGDIQHLLLDDTVLNSLFPVVFDDSAPLSDVVWPMLLPHEQYLIKKDPRARELIARVVRGAVLAFGFVPKIPDADDDPAVSSLLDFELADAAEVAEATDWIRYQWVREAGPTLTRMVAFLVATDFRDVAYALVTVVCKTYGGQRDVADTVRSGLEPFFSQDKAATLDRLLPEW